MKTQSPQRKAFSLIETVVATGILAIVLLFSITLGSVNLRNMVMTAQTVQATSLARTQLEKIRNIRDDIWQNQNSVGPACLPPASSQSWSCWVGTSLTPRNNVAIADSYQLRPSGSNYYLISGAPVEEILNFGEGEITYKKSVTIRNIDQAGISPISIDNPTGLNTTVNLTDPTYRNVKLLLVESKVAWNSYGRNQSVVLRTYLSDWLPRF